MRNDPNITTAEFHTILGVSETVVEKNISVSKRKRVEYVRQRRQGIGERCKDYNVIYIVPFRKSVPTGYNTPEILRKYYI